MSDTYTDGIEQTQTTSDGNPVYEWTGADGHIVAIPDGEEIFIPAVMAGNDTGLNELVTAVVTKLENTQLCFSNVINPELKKSLDGFEEEKEFAEQYGEYVTVLRGDWSVEPDTNRPEENNE